MTFDRMLKLSSGTLVEIRKLDELISLIEAAVPMFLTLMHRGLMSGDADDKDMAKTLSEQLRICVSQAPDSYRFDVDVFLSHLEEEGHSGKCSSVVMGLKESMAVSLVILNIMREVQSSAEEGKVVEALRQLYKASGCINVHNFGGTILGDEGVPKC